MKYFWHKKRITKEAVRFDYCLIIRLLNTGQQAEGPDGDEGPPASQCLLLPTENLKIIFKISRLIKCCWLVRPGCQLPDESWIWLFVFEVEYLRVSGSF